MRAFLRSYLPLALGASAVVGMALFGGCSSPKAVTKSGAGGSGGDECCFGPTGTGTTVTSTTSGPIGSFCEKWVAQCPNDGAKLGLTLQTCQSVCEMGQQFTLEPCWFAECSVETMQCSGTQPGDPAITVCAQGHGWEPQASSTSGSPVGSSGTGQSSSSSFSSGTGQSSSSSFSNSVSSTAQASSSTGGGACDNSGVCGDVMSGCLGCAVKGVCASELSACTNNAECTSFETCIDACAANDQACDTACENQYPTGTTLYSALVECALCQQCPVDCDGPGAGC